MTIFMLWQTQTRSALLLLCRRLSSWWQLSMSLSTGLCDKLPCVCWSALSVFCCCRRQELQKQTSQLHTDCVCMCVCRWALLSRLEFIVWWWFVFLEQKFSFESKDMCVCILIVSLLWPSAHTLTDSGTVIVSTPSSDGHMISVWPCKQSVQALSSSRDDCGFPLTVPAAAAAKFHFYWNFMSQYKANENWSMEHLIIKSFMCKEMNVISPEYLRFLSYLCLLHECVCVCRPSAL